MSNYIMNRESLKWHCEAMCKKFKDVPTSGTYGEHRLVLDLLEQTEWIPVSERLPKKEGFYLVSIEVMENPPKITTFTGISQYIVHDEFLGEVNDFNRENVIAWMPLPQPYTAESEEERGVSICDSCNNTKCIFQYGVKRTHCDMYKAESEEEK